MNQLQTAKKKLSVGVAKYYKKKFEELVKIKGNPWKK